MAQHGNDGFSDCYELCNPQKGYRVSCRKFCPDFTFPTTSRTSTVHGVTHILTTSLPKPNTVHFILVMVAVGITFAISIAVFICFKDKLYKSWKSCWTVFRKTRFVRALMREDSQNEEVRYPIQETGSPSTGENITDHEYNAEDVFLDMPND